MKSKAYYIAFLAVSIVIILLLAEVILSFYSIAVHIDTLKLGGNLA